LGDPLGLRLFSRNQVEVKCYFWLIIWFFFASFEASKVQGAGTFKRFLEKFEALVIKSKMSQGFVLLTKFFAFFECLVGWSEIDMQKSKGTVV
jgi:hypothetical protein